MQHYRLAVKHKLNQVGMRNESSIPDFGKLVPIADDDNEKLELKVTSESDISSFHVWFLILNEVVS